MILDRPLSHMAAMLFFSTIVVARASTMDADNSLASAQSVLALSYLIAAILLVFPSRWSQLYCSLALLWPTGFLALQVGTILFATSAPVLQAIPWVIMTGLMYWLFHAYTFGKASKAFYAKQEPLPNIKSLLQRKRPRSQDA